MLVVHLRPQLLSLYSLPEVHHHRVKSPWDIVPQLQVDSLRFYHADEPLQLSPVGLKPLFVLSNLCKFVQRELDIRVSIEQANFLLAD